MIKRDFDGLPRQRLNSTQVGPNLSGTRLLIDVVRSNGTAYTTTSLSMGEVVWIQRYLNEYIKPDRSYHENCYHGDARPWDTNMATGQFCPTCGINFDVRLKPMADMAGVPDLG